MPTYRLQKIVTTVYEIYVDADDDEQAEQIANSADDAGDDITDPGDFPQFVWDGAEPDG